MEYELSAMASGRSWNRPRPVSRHCEMWSALLRCMPGFEEAELWDEERDLTSPEELCAWGWSPKLLARCAWMTDVEREELAELTRWANDKRTSHALAASLDIDPLPWSRLLGSLEAFDDAVTETPHDWIVKHPLGVSGRERVSGRSGERPERARGWLKKRFDRGEELLFEPRVEITREHSVHVELADSWPPVYVGTCELLVGKEGTYRGQRVSAKRVHEEGWYARVEPALEVLWERGVRGPVSVDGFTGELGGERIERALSEINARVTFGRVALELAGAFARDGSMIWYHPPRSTDLLTEAPALTPGASHEPGIYSLPGSWRATPRDTTLVVIARDDDSLDELVGAMMPR